MANTVSKPKPVLVFSGVMTALLVITSGSAFADLIPAKYVALVVLVLGAINLGVGYVVHGNVTPVVAPTDMAGNALVPANSVAGVVGSVAGSAATPVVVNVGTPAASAAPVSAPAQSSTSVEPVTAPPTDPSTVDADAAVYDDGSADSAERTTLG